MISQEQALSALNAAERDEEAYLRASLDGISPDDLDNFAETLEYLLRITRDLASTRRVWW